MGILSVKFTVPPLLAKLVKDLEEPFRGAVGKKVAEAVRRGGPGSLEDQLNRRTTISGNNRRTSWPRRDGGPFAGRSSGRLRRAWMGGAASITRATGKTLTIGIDRRSLPYADIAQRPQTQITLRRRMRTLIGMRFGVWTRKSTRVIKIPGSPVSLNQQILDHVATVIYSESTGQGRRR